MHTKNRSTDTHMLPQTHTLTNTNEHNHTYTDKLDIRNTQIHSNKQTHTNRNTHIDTCIQ